MKKVSPVVPKSMATFRFRFHIMCGGNLMRIRVTQERLLGAALGAMFAGAVIFEQRRYIYNTISENQPRFQLREPVFGKKSRLEFVHLWNKAVDHTVGPVIESLSSRGK